MTADDVAFTPSEGVRLAHAVVASVCERAGIRALSIKGPVAEHYEFRRPRLAADADIWVDPAKWTDTCLLLQDRGWHTRVGRQTPSLLPQHSLTLIHNSWPCDIDLHRAFPGFFADENTVFEALWKGHQEIAIGHRTVKIPSRAASAAIAILHSLRTVNSSRLRRERSETERIVRQEFSTDEKREFYEVARAGGALWTMRDFIASAELGKPEVDVSLSTQANWTLFQNNNDLGTIAAWWANVHSVPMHRRPTHLLHALWVPRDEIPRNSREERPSLYEYISYQAKRLVRGVRGTLLHRQRVRRLAANKNARASRRKRKSWLGNSRAEHRIPSDPTI